MRKTAGNRTSAGHPSHERVIPAQRVDTRRTGTVT
ncbi:hypothetical protein GZL_06513 [Streptomyces sp. 769]|nr:hypothetical protein GZL_06513 [Streptomyces sp. 769]